MLEENVHDVDRTAYLLTKSANRSQQSAGLTKGEVIPLTLTLQRSTTTKSASYYVFRAAALR